MRKLFVSGMVLSMALSACAGAGTETLGPSSEVTALEARVAALEVQIADLQAAGDEPAGDHSEASSFDVVMAQYVMDSASFHGMDETLNETKVVDPAYIGTVTQVRQILLQTTWPEELHEQSTALVATLEEFAAALEADDGERAAALAAEVHTAQHDFSAAIDEWLGVGGDHGHGG